ncbi:hypothetical protein [Saccharopolyspora gloriosae]|uniref:hypothetical protein n=1 Tax=Saccharopolyspora gloriosae TaxID=455344 RepID=UPI001FB77C0E|nr:hypothetical protein [Saccharopolyspora gloriosae]
MRDGRIDIRETRGRRANVRLSVPVDTCVAAGIEEARAADGSAGLRLELEVEIWTFSRVPTTFSLRFPAEHRYRLAEFVHLLSWSASPLPMSWTRADPPAPGEPPGRRGPWPQPTASMQPRFDTADLHGWGAPEQSHTEQADLHGWGAPGRPLPDDRLPATTSVPDQTAELRDSPSQARVFDVSGASPTFGKLLVTGVPDTGEWLSFHPLPSSAEVYAFQPQGDSDPVNSGR